MEIPAAMLPLLSCSECGALLSRGPVFQTQDGAALCGGCTRPGRAASRNQLYEAAAQLLRFPCRHAARGCADTVPFEQDSEDVAHELGCPHRQYLCPVVPRGRCEWLGARRDMLDHCEVEHPDTVVRNGAELTHDVTKSSQKTYLLYALQVLFLLHTKVCLATGKIFHSIQLLSNPNNALKFVFTVDVKRDRYLVSKSYPVSSPTCLDMQEDTSLAMSINSLIEILDGFKGTSFTVTIWDKIGCVKCSTELKQYCYFNLDGWLCESCAPHKRSCKNKEKGCGYNDINEKCKKHELHFCPLSTWCHFCIKTTKALTAHYASAHGDITHASGSTWRNTFENDTACFITTNFGLVRCRSMPVNNKYHEIILSSSLLSAELSEVFCEIKLSNPLTMQSKIYNCSVSYNDVADCRLQVPNEGLVYCNGQYDICVTINRVVK